VCSGREEGWSNAEVRVGGDPTSPAGAGGSCGEGLWGAVRREDAPSVPCGLADARCFAPAASGRPPGTYRGDARLRAATSPVNGADSHDGPGPSTRMGDPGPVALRVALRNVRAPHNRAGCARSRRSRGVGARLAPDAHHRRAHRAGAGRTQGVVAGVAAPGEHPGLCAGHGSAAHHRNRASHARRAAPRVPPPRPTVPGRCGPTVAGLTPR
jgi:hypothetical protein